MARQRIHRNNATWAKQPQLLVNLDELAEASEPLDSWPAAARTGYVGLNICKIMMLGEMGVGKTSLTQQLKFGRIQGEYLSTVGFEVLTYEIEQGPGGVPFQFLIWDTDGSFGSAIFETVYLKGAQAAFFVGDVTRPETLNSLEELSTRFEATLPGRYSTLVLNKMDLLSPTTAVDLPESLALSGRSVFRTSAKTGEGVRSAFEDAAETIVRRGLV